MSNLIKEKCPVCKMELEEGKNYPDCCGRKFCSEKCEKEYREKSIKEQSNSGRGCGCC